MSLQWLNVVTFLTVTVDTGSCRVFPPPVFGAKMGARTLAQLPFNNIIVIR